VHFILHKQNETFLKALVTQQINIKQEVMRDNNYKQLSMQVAFCRLELENAMSIALNQAHY